MCSPVSRRTSGECNAIRSRGFGHSELTFEGIVESDSSTPPSPFLDSFRLADEPGTTPFVDTSAFSSTYPGIRAILQTLILSLTSTT